MAPADVRVRVAYDDMMTIHDFCTLYGASPQAGALVRLMDDEAVRRIYLQGLSCSATPLLFASVSQRVGRPVVFVLQDADEAGYFYHDLTQTMGQEQVLFFPSGYRRSVKYGQRDAASEILRTEVLTRITSLAEGALLYVVTYPEALAELVVNKQQLDNRRLHLAVGQTVDVS